MNKRAVILLTLLIILAKAVNAQPVPEEIKKMYRAYNEMENFYAESAIRVYSDYSSEESTVERKTIVKKNKNNYLYRMDDMTMLSTDKCFVLVNDEEKSIFYSDNPGKDKNLKNANAMPDVDSLLKRCDSVVFKNSAHGTYYILYSSRDVIRETHLFLDEKTHLISKLIYYYDKDFYPENNKVVIDYVKTDLSPVFAGDEFSSAKFVKKTKDTLVPVAAYAGYQVVKYDADGK